MKFVKIFWGYCSVWKVCFLIFFFFFWYGLETEMMCWQWKWRRKTTIPIHKHPTQFVFCVVGVMFVLGWGLFWRLIELKILMGIFCGYYLNWKVCFLILEGWRRWWVWALIDGGMKMSWMGRAEILLSFGVGEILFWRWRTNKEEQRKKEKWRWECGLL